MLTSFFPLISVNQISKLFNSTHFKINCICNSSPHPFPGKGSVLISKWMLTLNNNLWRWSHFVCICLSPLFSRTLKDAFIILPSTHCSIMFSITSFCVLLIFCLAGWLRRSLAAQCGCKPADRGSGQKGRKGSRLPTPDPGDWNLHFNKLLRICILKAENPLQVS